MSVAQHCQCLTRALLAWEAHAHAELGHFPPGFQARCREHAAAYLTSLETELRADLAGVREALARLRPPLCAPEENAAVPEKHGRPDAPDGHA
jgi:hypothetical protein